MLSNNQNTTNQPFNQPTTKTDDRKSIEFKRKIPSKFVLPPKLVEEHKPNNQDTLHKDTTSLLPPKQTKNKPPHS